MAIIALQEVYDAALDKIALSNRISVTSQQPTTRAEAHTTYMLANMAVTPGGAGDFTLAAGDISGRKLTLAEINGTVSNTGSGAWLNLYDDTKLYYTSHMDPLNEGTAQAGDAGSITLAAGAVTVDGEFVGSIVEIYDGTGSGQTRIITDSVALTQLCTVGVNWGVNPDATSVYRVIGQLYTAGNPCRVPLWKITEIADFVAA